MAEAVPNILSEKLFTFLEFVLESCKLGDVTESGLLDSRVDLLDSLLGIVNLSSSFLCLDVGICLEV